MSLRCGLGGNDSTTHRVVVTRFGQSRKLQPRMPAFEPLRRPNDFAVLQRRFCDLGSAMTGQTKVTKLTAPSHAESGAARPVAYLPKSPQPIHARHRTICKLRAFGYPLRKVTRLTLDAPAERPKSAS
jgi:hypothetical protein